MLQNRTELRINTAQNTEIKIHAYAKRQDVNLYHVTKFFHYFFYASFNHRNRSGLFLSAYILF